MKLNGTLQIKDLISTDALLVRDVVESLRSELSQVQEIKALEWDFRDIRMISRAVADSLIKIAEEFETAERKIIWKNVSPEVEQILKAVKDRHDNPRPHDRSELVPVEVSFDQVADKF